MPEYCVIEFPNHPGNYLTEGGIQETPSGCYFDSDITKDISKAKRLSHNEAFDFARKHKFKLKRVKEK